MNLIAVQCWRAGGDQEAEPRLGVVIAPGQTEAEQLCRSIYSSEGFTDFKAQTVFEGSFDGPARVLGYTGQSGAFGWKK
jgi:hypothetical protein